jgi:hypothetical protein
MFRSKLGSKTCLLTKLICCDAVELPMSLDRNNLGSVCINGVVRAFTKQVETPFFEIANQIIALD